jgi:hypothetical protein
MCWSPNLAAGFLSLSMGGEAGRSHIDGALTRLGRHRYPPATAVRSGHLPRVGDEAEPHVLAGGNPTHVVGDLNELQAAVGHHAVGGGTADSGPINEILDAVAETG